MEKLKVESNKKYSMIFLVLGIIALLAAIIVVIRDIHFVSNAVELKATVAECKVDYNTKGSRRSKDVAVYVDYEYNGREYNHVLVEQRKEREHKKGSTIKIYVNPKEPREPLADTSVKIRIKLLFCGGVLFAAGAFSMWLDVRSERKKREIKENGITVYANITRVCKANKSMNSPMEIRCRYEDEEGRDYTYVSESAYNDLARYFYEGELIEVKVKPDDYTKYYIDLEALWAKKH